MTYQWDGRTIDSVELKCLVVSRGLTIDRAVYKKFGGAYRLSPNALTCNCFKLPDGTIVMATDLGMHLSTLSSMFSWDNLKLFKHMADMRTDFRLALSEGEPVLLYQNAEICPVSFLPGTDFFKKRTKSGLPFIGNAVLQGCDWVAFQCLWPCEYAIAGKACAFCFSGGQFEALARRGKPMPGVPTPADVAEIVGYAAAHCGVNSVQITGGSTFESSVEEGYITEILGAIHRAQLTGEILLYITPPDDTAVLDRYFGLGASRVACSLEVWDDALAEKITPGKRAFTTKERHLRALTYIAERHGPGKAFSNFIIGLEPLSSLLEGAASLAARGIIPAASVWMPFGKPVLGSMKPPGLDFFRAVKEGFAELYLKYNLSPAGNCGLNVCVERDIRSWAEGMTPEVDAPA
jgi:hypothetical protein